MAALEEDTEATPADIFFDDVLTDLERRRSLERDGRVAADIELDFDRKGPLYLYLQQRRQEAHDSLRDLVTTDAKDAVAVATAQANIVEYLKCCQWITARMEAAATAEEIIKEEFGTNDDEQQRD